MDKDFFYSKLEEIRDKNISEEEKIKEINKFKNEYFKKSLNDNKKRNKQVVIGILGIICIYVSLFIVQSGDILFTEIIMKGLSVFCIGYVFYWIYKKIKLQKNKKYWINMTRTELSSYQNMCEELCNNIRGRLISKRYMFIIKFITILCINIIPCFYIVKNINSIVTETTILIIVCGYFISLAISLVIMARAKEDYISLYKKEVISQFITNLNNQLEYQYNVNKYNTIESDYKYINFDKLFGGEWRIDVEDYISGSIKDIPMEMGDIVAKEYHRKGEDKILFKGNFLILNTNKVFEESKILVNKLNIFDKNELINIDNSKFNKYFEIHAQNKDTVQDYLNPSLIEFIADFRETYKIDFEICFKDKIYIRFYTGNMFEPKMFGKIVDEYSVYQYYVITKFAKELVEKLDNM